MAEKMIAGYGTWESAITPELVSSSAISLGSQIEIDGNDIYWVEMRPSENGRNVIVRRSPHAFETDVNPAPFNARTRVHEYGGGAFLVDKGTVYFSNFADQCLYRQTTGSFPVPVTSENGMRYADGRLDRSRNRLICVCEDHSHNDREPENFIGAVDIGTGNITRLISGNDFYASPRLSPDGKKLVWLTWNHPNMPWDYTELWQGEFNEHGAVTNSVRLVGGRNDAVLQPEFSPEGRLYFISEKTGWLNLYRWTENGPEKIYPIDAEFGYPHWVFGQSAYSFESEKRILCTWQQDGKSYLGSIDTETRKLTVITIPYTSISCVRAGKGFAVLLTGSPTESSRIVKIDLETNEITVLKRSTDIELAPEYVSVPEPIEFPVAGGLKAHALYYRPKNPRFAAPVTEKPPLMVMSHGGPTGATDSTFSLSVQFWTSRGFAVADVNYGGSTGYGREYRQRLDGNWGVVDIDDCCNCARYLIRRREVDGNRTAIRGGSAGGYTTLAALTFRYVFRAGASYYGISDLEALAKDTHKFESRYLDRIVGPYPEQKELYLQRSPIHAVENLSCPVIFFQGEEDKVVPPSQAEMMVNALRAKKIPVAYLLFEGEQHGFRKAENIKRALEAELYFYGKVFDFEPADDIKPIKIENLR